MRLTFAFVLIAAARTAAAQMTGTPVGIARSYTIESRILHEQRTFDVTLPAGYARDTAQHYPVIYVLDGEFEGEIAMAIARFYSGSSMLPNTIVVGIRNTHRTRDMTPAAVAGFTPPPDENGGADQFLGFIANELIPQIEKTYRTAPMRVLIGHSLGGLFALHAITKRPDLFTGYVVMEPATWWNNAQPYRDANAALQRADARRARVMLVNAMPFDTDTTSWGGNRPMVRNFHVTGETHASMAAQGMLVGLRAMFADFRPSAWQPGSRPITMLDHFDSLSARLGYAAAIPEDAYALVYRMSKDSRWFDDAAQVIDRMEKALGSSRQSKALRAELAAERLTPVPPGFIPLVMPPHRPTPSEAAKFLGRWRLTDGSEGHDVDITAMGDTIAVHDRMPMPRSEPFDADDPVIQVTANGELEWALPWFHGLAALLVLRARIEPDGTMVVRREVRGWVPISAGPDESKVERFRRQ